MAKAKPGTRKGKPGATALGESARQKNILALRGTEEWKVWLDDLAAKNGAPVTVTIEQALRDLAEKIGHRPAPARY
jgi:hypothetical protein